MLLAEMDHPDTWKSANKLLSTGHLCVPEFASAKRRIELSRTKAQKVVRLSLANAGDVAEPAQRSHGFSTESCSETFVFLRINERSKCAGIELKNTTTKQSFLFNHVALGESFGMLKVIPCGNGIIYNQLIIQFIKLLQLSFHIFPCPLSSFRFRF